MEFSSPPPDAVSVIKLFPLTGISDEQKKDPRILRLFQLCTQLEHSLSVNCQNEQILLREETQRAIKQMEIHSLESGICFVHRENGDKPWRCLPRETRKTFQAIIQNQEFVQPSDDRVAAAAKQIIALPPHSQFVVSTRFPFERKILVEAYEGQSSKLLEIMKRYHVIAIYPHHLNPEHYVGSSTSHEGKNIKAFIDCIETMGYSTLYPTPENQLWSTLTRLLIQMNLHNRFDFSLFSKILDERDMKSLEWMSATEEGQSALQHILESDPANTPKITMIASSISLEEIKAVRVDPMIGKAYDFVVKIMRSDHYHPVRPRGDDFNHLVFLTPTESTFLEWLKGTPEGREVALRTLDLYPARLHVRLRDFLEMEQVEFPEEGIVFGAHLDANIN